MDSTRTTVAAIALVGSLAFLPAALTDASGAAAGSAATSTSPTFRVVGASEELRELADWALGRFEEAGLELPALEIRFHRDPADCQGRMGLFWEDEARVDMCARSFDPTGRKVLLHELAHAWTESQLSDEQRDAFLDLRGLDFWEAPETPWELRGIEHAAEIMVWALQDHRTVVVRLHDTEPDQLQAAYALLTGAPAVFRHADPVEQDYVSPEASRFGG